MSKKTFIFLVSGLIVALGFFVVQAAGPTLQRGRDLTIPSDSYILLPGTTARSLNRINYGGNAATADYATTAGAATNATNATNADTVDTYHLNQAVTSDANPTFGTVYTNNWFRSSGATGWYNETYTGGMWMQNANYVEVYGSKGFLVPAGNVGIGTTVPDHKLTVAGNIQILDGRLNFNTAAAGLHNTYTQNIAGVVSNGVDANNYFAFNVSNAAGTISERMRINGSGNVGIGTTSPSSELEVGSGASGADIDITINGNSTGAGASAIKFNNGSVNSWRIGRGALDGSADFQLYNYTTATANLVVKSTTGNVGIGDAAPGAKLSVVGNATIGYASAQTAPANGLIIQGNVGIGQTAPGSALSVNGGISAGTYSATAAPSGGMIISGNVGIGTTAPANRLMVSGSNLMFTMTNPATTGDTYAQMRFSAGSSDAYIWNNTQGASSGFYGGPGAFNIYNASNAPLVFSTNATARATISAGGNVGIGTTGPGEKLNVNGNILLGVPQNNLQTGTTYYNYAPNNTTNTGDGNGNYYGNNLQITAGGWSGQLYDFPVVNTPVGMAGNLILRAGDANETSNNGEGSGVYTGGDVKIYAGYAKQGSLYATIPTLNQGKISFYTATAATRIDNTVTERMTILGTGNVGIGDAAPGAKLSVVGNATIGYASAQTAPANGLIIKGNVGIGTTNFTGGAAPELNIKAKDASNAAGLGLQSFDGTASLYLRSGTGSDGQLIGYQNNLQFGVTTGIGTSGYVEKVRITSGGNVGIGTTGPGYKLDVNGDVRATSFIYNSSDRALKKNIVTIKSPLEKILQLRGVTFNWKKDNTQSIGLIAQEVEKVFPELVGGEEGSKAVAYGNLVAPLIEAVKEQQRKIDELETRITILEMGK